MEKETKRLIKNAEEWEEIVAVMQKLSDKDFNSREYELIFRSLERTRQGEDLKFAVLSNHTLDLLPTYLSVLCANEKLKLSSYIGPFNQYFQELLSGSSGLLTFNPDLIYLDLTIPNLSPVIHQQFLSLDSESKKNELNKIIDTIENLVTLTLKNTQSNLLISNFVQPVFTQAGIADYKLEISESEWYLKLNFKLIELFRNENRVFILDKCRLTSRVGSNIFFNPKMYYLAKMEINEKGMPFLAEEILRYIIAIKGLTKKCLFLDLDNTLWGGVVGEEGVDGIKIGKGYPEGEVFYALQSYFKTLKQRGIILALASKNNHDDAKEVFDKKSDMPLSWDDFATTKINWEPKAKNISEMVASLNLGVDSTVFIDDNPVERTLVNDILKSVAVPDLHDDPATYLKTIQALYYFEKLFITQDDTDKVEQYKQNAKRDDLKHEIGDMGAFLSKLGTELKILKANQSHAKRIHQLFSKTNQFNVTTKRYNINEVEEFINSENYSLFVFSVKDNFGDLGIVGLVLVELKSKTANIDSFILSCRAMGRGIETAVMDYLKQVYLMDGGFKKILASYVPTQKNKPALDFFSSQGLLVEDESNEEVTYYQLLDEYVNLQGSPGMTIILEK